MLHAAFYSRKLKTTCFGNGKGVSHFSNQIFLFSHLDENVNFGLTGVGELP